MVDEQEQEQIVSRIAVIFENPGSVVFEMQPDNVSAHQLLALAAHLRIMAERVLLRVMDRNEQIQMQQMNQIETPHQGKILKV